MDRARVIASLVAASTFALASAACIDLFHSTDFETLCDIDANAAGCVDSGPAVDTAPPPIPPMRDFCKWSHTDARLHAEHACAWLGACESPFGGNAYGACMVQALLAYDCAINPNRHVQGDLLKYWDCLWRAQTCGDVHACVWPQRSNCSATTTGYVQCVHAEIGGGDSGADPNVLIACGPGSDKAAPIAVENCVAQGQSCAIFPTTGACNGTTSPTCDSGLACEDTHLHACDGDRDRGVDCRNYGAGSCVLTDAGGGCLANDSVPCEPTNDIACDGGVASSCPSGQRETVDCAALLGASPAACGAADPLRPWDVASACNLSGNCADDTCDSVTGTISSCARGAPFSVSCKSAGLRSCRLAPLADGGAPAASCVAP